MLNFGRELIELVTNSNQVYQEIHHEIIEHSVPLAIASSNIGTSNLHAADICAPISSKRQLSPCSLISIGLIFAGSNSTHIKETLSSTLFSSTFFITRLKSCQINNSRNISHDSISMAAGIAIGLVSLAQGRSKIPPIVTSLSLAPVVDKIDHDNNIIKYGLLSGYYDIDINERAFRLSRASIVSINASILAIGLICLMKMDQNALHYLIMPDSIDNSVQYHPTILFHLVSKHQFIDNYIKIIIINIYIYIYINI